MLVLTCTTKSAPTSLLPGQLCLMEKEMLGQGASGRVLGGYVGLTAGGVRAVAVKQQWPKTKREVASLAMEVRVHREVTGAHIVRFSEEWLSEEEGMHTIVLERCAHSLSDVRLHALGKTKGGLLSGLRMMSDVLEGLATLHAAGFMHRDVKPANSFVRKSGKVVVGDFGFAGVIGSGEAFAGGTMGYFAPELLNAELLDGRADVFAVGVMTATLVTGEHGLFAVSKKGDWVAKAHARASAGIPAKVKRGKRYRAAPPAAKDFADWLLTADRAARPSAVEALGSLRAVIRALEVDTAVVPREVARKRHSALIEPPARPASPVPSPAPAAAPGLRPFRLGANAGLRPLRLAGAARPARAAPAPSTPSPVSSVESSPDPTPAPTPVPAPAAWFGRMPAPAPATSTPVSSPTTPAPAAWLGQSSTAAWAPSTTSPSPADTPALSPSAWMARPSAPVPAVKPALRSFSAASTIAPAAVVAAPCGLGLGNPLPADGPSVQLPVECVEVTSAPKRNAWGRFKAFFARKGKQ